MEREDGEMVGGRIECTMKREECFRAGIQAWSEERRSNEKSFRSAFVVSSVNMESNLTFSVQTLVSA